MRQRDQDRRKRAVDLGISDLDIPTWNKLNENSAKLFEECMVKFTSLVKDDIGDIEMQDQEIRQT